MKFFLSNTVNTELIKFLLIVVYTPDVKIKIYTFNLT